MTSDAWAIIGTSVVGLIIIPLMVMAFRSVIRQTRTETRLEGKIDGLGSAVSRLEDTKDVGLKEIISLISRFQTELLAQMRDDRAVTDRRLRWLEEKLWTREAQGNDTRNT